MVDLQGQLQCLACGVPGLHRQALLPEDLCQDSQGGDALVVLHAEVAGETVDVIALGQALEHLFGELSGLVLLAGVMQGQHSQALGTHAGYPATADYRSVPTGRIAGFAPEPAGSCRC